LIRSIKRAGPPPFWAITRSLSSGSRIALARILDIDPATVFRQERGVMSALWHYAMRGVEAEAKLAKPVLQSHQARIDSRDLIPDAMVERGHRYTGEKMKQLKPRPKRAKVAAVQETDRAGLPRTHVPSRRAVMAAADRAEERSKRNRQSRPGS
jgi:hypothetical protein